MSEPLEFSVLIPVYHKENPTFLSQAIESMLAQTLYPGEIVIVEDGPLTKELYDTLQRYHSGYPDLFRIIKLPENRGMGPAMQAGLEACRFALVARMDSDDIARPDRFRRQIDYFSANPTVDLLGASIEEFNLAPGDLRRIRRLPADHAALVSLAKKRNPFNHMAVMYKKSKALLAGGYWSVRAFEDYHLWYQMIRAGCILGNLEDILVDVRVGNDMLARRRGWSFLAKERQLFLLMRRDRFISLPRYWENMALRLVLRLMPKQLLAKFYDRFCRENYVESRS